MIILTLNQSCIRMFQAQFLGQVSVILFSMSITLDVSAGLLNEPDEVLLGLVEAGHVGSYSSV